MDVVQETKQERANSCKFLPINTHAFTKRHSLPPCLLTGCCLLVFGGRPTMDEVGGRIPVPVRFRMPVSA